MQAPLRPTRLKLGLINIMPYADEYALSIGRALASVKDLYELYPIRLHSHEYRSSGLQVDRYLDFDELVRRVRLDLLLVTGAPVEHLPYEEIRYWDELHRIFTYAQTQVASVLGICFGGLAIGRFLGIDKRVLGDKLFGVHRLAVAAGSERYVGSGRRHIELALSTWALLDEGQVTRARQGTVRTLARHAELGPLLLATQDDRFVMVLGHPEYTVERLQHEWQRDLPKGIAYTRRFTTPSFAEMGRRLQEGGSPILENWLRSHARPQAVVPSNTLKNALKALHR